MHGAANAVAVYGRDIVRTGGRAGNPSRDRRRCGDRILTCHCSQLVVSSSQPLAAATNPPAARGFTLCRLHTSHLMTPSAETSTEITRRSRSNLAFALLCLPKERRRDMVSFYAFCRLVDDIADEGPASVNERRATLEECRRVVLNPTHPSDQPILNETAALPARYGFDPALLSEIIDGVASDLDHQHYATLEDLSQVMVDASICGLGQAAPNVVRSVQKYFAHEIGGAA